MNVFEDLIGELKEENLLEDTILEVNLREDDRNGKSADSNEAAMLASPSEVYPEPASESKKSTGKAADSAEEIRKRATDNVSSLQMVEHVLSGVEREHMQISPASYDDLQVKKALHEFVQLPSGADSAERLDAEARLLRQTESWYAALASRDKKISVANLRRFCEESRPVLSSQALTALAGFYKNMPIDEKVRGKFDFVMTRLVSRDIGGEKREMFVSRSQTVAKITSLYADWSNVSHHSEYETSLAVAGLERLIEEAELAATLDELLGNGFFNTVRSFKEEAGEVFFAPQVLGAAIESNIRIGNKFVDLVAKANTESPSQDIAKKYGNTNDSIVSDAVAQTLRITDLVRMTSDELAAVESVAAARTSKKMRRIDVPDQATNKIEENSSEFKVFGVDGRVVMTVIIIIAICGLIYLFS